MHCSKQDMSNRKQLLLQSTHRNFGTSRKFGCALLGGIGAMAPSLDTAHPSISAACRPMAYRAQIFGSCRSGCGLVLTVLHVNANICIPNTILKLDFVILCYICLHGCFGLLVVRSRMCQVLGPMSLIHLVRNDFLGRGCRDAGWFRRTRVQVQVLDGRSTR